MYVSPIGNNPIKPKKPVSLIISVVLGVVVIGLSILSFTSLDQASKATTTVEAQKKVAADAAREDQKTKDAAAFELASETPYRSYIAPVEYGSFEVKFPKSWSGYSIENVRSLTQVDLALHPNFVKSQNGNLDMQAARVQLIQKDLETTIKQDASTKTVKRAEITVAGVPGVELTGTFSNKRTVRLIAIPVRDKTLVIINENKDYTDQFNEILSQIKVNP